MYLGQTKKFTLDNYLEKKYAKVRAFHCLKLF